MLRILVAGLVGGIAMFIWSAIAHIALPLGRVGLSDLPNQAPIIAALQAGLGTKSGLYIFPSMVAADGSAISMGGYDKLLKTSPQGLIVYQPPGGSALNPRQLLCEFLLELVEATIAAFMLRYAAIRGFPSRLGYITLIGVAAVITTNGSYWNWYGFPLAYTLAYAFTQLMGYVVAGAMISVVYGWWRRQPGDA